MTDEQLSAITGLTARRHRQIADDGMVPHPNRKGEWEDIPTLAGMVKHFKAMHEKKNESVMGLEREQTRLTAAKAELSEIELARAKGEVIEVETVKQVWSNHIISARRVVLGSKLLPAEQDEILDELSSFRPEDLFNTGELSQPSEDIRPIQSA